MHSDLIAKHFKSEVFKYGELDVKIFDELIKCVLKSDDIPTFHAEIIIKSQIGRASCRERVCYPV